MNKKSLITAMQVEQRNGARKVVLLNTPQGDVIVEVNGETNGHLDNYNLDLFSTISKEFDIMKIYKSPNVSNYLIKKFPEDCLIWERELDIDTSVKINGKKSILKNLSLDTLLKIYNNS